MDLARDAEGMVDKLGELVPPADEPENAVLADNARVVRWAGPAFALFSLILASLDRLPGVPASLAPGVIGL